MEHVLAGIAVVPVRTPTLPPATHTNTWVLGEGALLVVDPASPWDDERRRLDAELGERLAAGERIEAILLTHHHHDHVSGAVALRDALRARGVDAPILAHPITAELVGHALPVDRHLHDGDALEVGGIAWQVWHTPGHAAGHLVLHDAARGVMVAGDMVAGVGTIAIDPDEGHLGDYLAQLTRMRDAHPRLLLPAHGPAQHAAVALLETYLAHRHLRSDQIREALVRHGEATPEALAPRIYPELPPAWQRLAARQILSHLRWLQAHGVVAERPDGHFAAR